MRNRNVIETGSRVLLLLGQIIVLVFCIIYIQYVYNSNILPDKRAKDSFVQTNCFILSKRLSTRGHVIHEYRADFLISYTVNGEQYSRWVSENGLDFSFSHNHAEQEDRLSQFNIGDNYLCWYDPDNPQIAILVLRHNWLSTFPLILPSMIAVMIFYFLLINIFQLLGYARIAAREVKEKRSKE